MLKAQIFNFLTLLCGVITIIISIYTIITKTSSILSVIFFVITLILYGISRYFNYKNTVITKEEKNIFKNNRGE